jgi:hypothetical protein
MQPMVFPRGDLRRMSSVKMTQHIKLWLEEEEEQETAEIERQKKKQKEREKILAEQRRKARGQEQKPEQGSAN